MDRFAVWKIYQENFSSHQGPVALQLHGKGCLVHKSVATLLGLANKAEICGLGFGPAKSAAAQVRGISVSVTMSILS